ncbi:TetR/AcrR family transcriptional regulator [Glutamicibacter sp. NPDC087344]|uniref:TetR/AcrR family transcriptional regulator n=1 Tax=Glutamicibacter sp. NPDC087344 TaxID=3363994 RepID=UPI0037FBF091
MGRPRKSEILDGVDVLGQVLHSFVLHGYEGVSMRSLSAQLGRGHTFLADRYGTKRALWEAAVAHAALLAEPAIEQAFTQQGDDRATLIATVRALHQTAAGAADFARLVDHEARIESDRLDFLIEQLASLNRPLQALFDRLVADGTVRPMPWYLFYFLVTAPTSLYCQPPLARRLGRPDNADDHELLSDLVLGGLLTGGLGRI